MSEPDDDSGVKLIQIDTPKGNFRVWTKRVGDNPRIKLLLLHDLRSDLEQRPPVEEPKLGHDAALPAVTGPSSRRMVSRIVAMTTSSPTAVLIIMW